jgi:dTDP-4-amino-4,6-dideoxygalactose transaminase
MSTNIKQYYNNNDFVELFEQKLCEYTGAPFAVVVDRCTNAILLSFEIYPNEFWSLGLETQLLL